MYIDLIALATSIIVVNIYYKSVWFRILIKIVNYTYLETIPMYILNSKFA